MTETILQLNTMTLERRVQDGVELYVDTKSMLAFASTKGLARICGVTNTAIKKFFMVNQITPIKAEVPTTKGIRAGNLWSHQHVKKAVLKYNSDLAEKIMDCGTNTFLLGLAGVKVTAQVNPEPSLFSVLTATRRDPMPWECLFNSDWIFWAQKTTGWRWNCSVMGKFINWTTYDYLPEEVAAELKSLACDDDGYRVRKMHQHLTKSTREIVEAHLTVVLEMMRAANGNKDLFDLLMKNRFGEYRPQRELPGQQMPLFEIKRQLLFEIT